MDYGNSTTNDPFEIFASLDTNSDGSISIDEVRKSKFNPEGVAGSKSKSLGNIFKELDINGNGVIDPIEMDPALNNYSLKKKIQGISY